MNTVLKKNLLLWAVIALIIANVAMLAIFYHTRIRERHPADNPGRFIQEQLGLDDAQRQKVIGLSDEHHRQTEALRHTIAVQEDSLFSLLRLSYPSDSLRDAIISRVAVSKGEMDRLAFEHFKRVRLLCRPDQQKKFDEIIHDVVRMISPLPPHRPPPPPAGGITPPPPPPPPGPQ